AQLATSLSAVSDDTAKTNGVTVGQAVADAVIAQRQGDGWDDFVDYQPNGADGKWQPTYPMFADALVPQYATLDPFAMTSDSQFRPAGPPAINSAQFRADLSQVESLGSADSTTRTADQTEIARFWSDGGGTATPPGHWNSIAANFALAQNKSLA